MRRLLYLLTAFTVVPLLFPPPVTAGGPLGASVMVGRRYLATAFPLRYRTDPGTLGAFSNAQAVTIANYAFAQWDNIGSAALSFTNAGALARDVTAATDAYISGTGQYSDGINPVVFDHSGAIIDARLGVGAKNSVLGIAGSAYNTVTNNYVEGYAIINGFLSGTASAADDEKYKATMTHEIGHFLGLSHSQIGLHGDYPTMYPVIQKPSIQLTLDADDTAAAAELYPALGYIGRTGAITGTVRRSDNTNLSGLNVVAMNVATGATYSTVVDYFSGGGAAFLLKPPATGAYTIAGLPPGSYYVRIEPLNATFTGGSSVASYNTPINLTVDREWYNGANESGDMLTDNTNEQSAVTVTAGLTTSGINFVANQSPSTSVLTYNNGNYSVLLALPSSSVTRYATRYTAPTAGSVVALKLRFEAGSSLPTSGTLTATLHANASGGLAGIPGTSLGSVNIPFSNLVADQENIIYLRGIGTAANFAAGTNFHVALSTNGVGTIRLQSDNGNPTQNRSSFYTATGGWRNMAQGFSTGYNIIMNVLYSSTLVGAGTATVAPQPMISASAQAVEFGQLRVGRNLTRSVTVTNSGEGSLEVRGADIIGIDSASFSIVSGGGAFTLPPGASRSLSILFAPTTAGGKNGESATKSATLLLTSNAPTSPNSIPITGTGVKPVASALISGVSFGVQSIGGTRVIDTALIYNSCTDTLHISGTSFSGADAAAFKVIEVSPSSIVAPDSTHHIRIEFRPTERREYQATLRLVHDDEPTMLSEFPITGLGIAPTLTAPVAVAVGSARVGRSGTSSIMIRNDGNAPLRVGGMTIEGEDASDFEMISPTFAPGTPAVLEPSTILPIEIRFTPTEAGRRTARLMIASDDPDRPTTTVELEGTALLGRLAADPAIDFGDATIDASREREVKVMNSGTDTLILGTPAVSGTGFTIVNAPSASTPLAPGEEGTFTLRFTPGTTGPHTGTLMIRSDLPEAPLEIALTGEGRSPGLALSRSNIVLGITGHARSLRDSFMLRNSGNAPLTVTALDLEGGSSSAFRILSPAPPLTLGPGDSATVTVELVPTNTNGVYSTVLIVRESGGRTGSVTLTATVIGTSVATIDALDFGRRIEGAIYDTTVAIRNIGPVDLRIDSIATTGTLNEEEAACFRVVTDAPFVIPPGDSAEIRIIFTPNGGEGEYTGSITLHVDNNVDDSIVIAMSGSAVSGSTTGVAVEGVTGEETVSVAGIAPNPSYGDLTLLWRVGGGGEIPVSIVVTDARGAVAATLLNGAIIADGYERSLRADLASLPSGTYFVTIRTPRGRSTGRFVILR